MPQNILPQVLVVEDLINWRRLYKVWLNRYCQLFFSTSRPEAQQQINRQNFDVVIMDLGLPDPEDGIATIRHITEVQPLCKIIVVSAHTDRQLYLRVQQLGVYAVFRKDERLETELPILVRKAREMTSLERENEYLRNKMEESTARFQILGSSPAANKLRERARFISQVDAPVMITGPTGSGKNYFANLVHLLSPRASRPFITISCANLPQHLVEDELFGHARGAFTGADSAKTGKFKLADGGTIFLDEIGEIPVDMQAKLLQVIEDKSFYPLGSMEKVSVDVRIFSATNRDLILESERGNFRRDLYYRLAGFTEHMPPLTDRLEDIPVYLDFFIQHVCREENLPVPQIDPDIYQAAQKLPWPGNIRELKNLVTRLLLFHPHQISAKDLYDSNVRSTKSIVEQGIQNKYSLKQLTALYARELYRLLRHKGEVLKIMKIDRKTLNRLLKMSDEEL